jgi:hypothetical protein
VRRRRPGAGRLPEGGYPHTDAGVGVRRACHTLRATASEDFNEQVKAGVAAHGAVPTKGLAATRRFARGAILVYQLLLWHRYQQGLALRLGLKPALQAA